MAKLLAVAVRMIDLFAKRLSTEVATLAGGFRRLWGRHQLLTATDKRFLLLGTRMSSAAVVGGGGVWSETLRAVMTLKHHERVGVFVAKAPLFSCDMMEVEKVRAAAANEAGIFNMTAEKSPVTQTWP